MASTVTSPRPESLLRRALTGSLPNLVQWFNLYAYATFAPYFDREFFDREDRNSLVWVYGIFALSFVMRPLGSWLFGRLADQRGRRAALTGSVVLMSIGSLALAIAPTRDLIGPAAAAVLIIVMIVQGLATGGEYGVSSVALSEAGTTGHRGYVSSFQSVSLIGGMVLAQGLLLVMLVFAEKGDIAAWGWRVAFALGALGGLVLLIIERSRIPDTPRPTRAAGSVRVLLTEHRRAFLWVMLMTAGGTMAFYTVLVVAPTALRASLEQHGDAGARGATVSVLITLLVFMVLQPLGGALSDRIGRRALLIFFGAGGVLGAAAFTLSLTTVSSQLVAFVLLLTGTVVLSGYTSVNTIAKAEAFPASVRTLGVGLGYAIANSLFGGTTPMFFHAAHAAGHLEWFAIVITVVIAVSLTVYVFFTPDRSTALERDA
jgi:MHS family alpha-ketoglutarate permease-like MFS transporter